MHAFKYSMKMYGIMCISMYYHVFLLKLLLLLLLFLLQRVGGLNWIAVQTISSNLKAIEKAENICSHLPSFNCLPTGIAFDENQPIAV